MSAGRISPHQHGPAGGYNPAACAGKKQTKRNIANGNCSKKCLVRSSSICCGHGICRVSIKRLTRFLGQLLEHARFPAIDYWRPYLHVVSSTYTYQSVTPVSSHAATDPHRHTNLKYINSMIHDRTCGRTPRSAGVCHPWTLSHIP